MSKPRDRVKKILDWEELERAPNTHGALSFLKSAAEIVSIRKGDTPTRVEPSNPTTVVDTTTVVRKPVTPVHRPHPRPCYLAQDGHSLGETALYQVLWARAKQETADTRVITAGWRTMKRLCGMSDKSCKRNTTGLIEKFRLGSRQRRGHRHTYRAHLSHSLVRKHSGPTQSSGVGMGFSGQTQAVCPEGWVASDEPREPQNAGRQFDHSGRITQYQSDHSG